MLIRNVYDEGELDEISTTEESSVVQDEGGRRVRRTVRLYNLDVIISVGYRVKSVRGTQFRIWATGVLRGTCWRATPSKSADYASCGSQCASSSTCWTPEPRVTKWRPCCAWSPTTIARWICWTATTISAWRIADNALVAMTLLIAVSEPAERDVIIAIMMHLLDGRA